MLRATSLLVLAILIGLVGYTRAPALGLAPAAVSPDQPVASRFADAMRAYDSEDFASAYRLFLSLADLGMAPAQAMLGVCHLKGQGTDANAAEAAVWFARAAAAGYPSAQVALADLYMSGQGVGRDLGTAYRWLLVAELRSDQGIAPGIRSRLAAIGQRLDPAQIADARSWARQWRPNRPLQP